MSRGNFIYVVSKLQKAKYTSNLQRKMASCHHKVLSMFPSKFSYQDNTLQ